jgi:glycosyltransferase involved in cell wall biosynthesis
LEVKVTLGLCVRNCASTISKTLESIINQDYPPDDMEVIIVDDESEDETLSIVKGYSKKLKCNVKIFRQKWMGLGPTRNFIIGKAKSKYILWVDGDMILSKDYVKKIINFMECNPKVGIAKGMYGMLDGLNSIAMLENIDYVIEDQEHLNGKPLSTLGTGGAVYRMEAIKQVGGFDNKIKGAAEDADIELRIRNEGWLLCKVNCKFWELRRSTLKALWSEYVWRGYGSHYLYHVNSNFIQPIFKKAFPFIGLLLQFKRSIFGYKNILRKKIIFLLPIHWAFKGIAWMLGFISAHWDGYGHTSLPIKTVRMSLRDR